MIDLGRHNLLGIDISAVDYEAAVAKIIAHAKEGRRCTTTALAVHGVMTGVLDAEHRYRLNRLDLVVPDGQPVRWAINALYATNLPDRVYGPNLMLRVCEKSAQEGVGVFLFGGTQETLEKLSHALRSKFPDLNICGMRASKFRPLNLEETEGLQREIIESGARIAMVGIGCPRQEVWAYEMGDRLSMPILAVGAAFAFHSGMLSQAPEWMQRCGLEWLYRFTREPLRLWRRYLFLNPAYAALVVWQYCFRSSFSQHRESPPKKELRYG